MCNSPSIFTYQCRDLSIPRYVKIWYSIIVGRYPSTTELNPQIWEGTPHESLCPKLRLSTMYCAEAPAAPKRMDGRSLMVSTPYDCERNGLRWGKASGHLSVKVIDNSNYDSYYEYYSAKKASRRSMRSFVHEDTFNNTGRSPANDDCNNTVFNLSSDRQSRRRNIDRMPDVQRWDSNEVLHSDI